MLVLLTIVLIYLYLMDDNNLEMFRGKYDIPPGYYNRIDIPPEPKPTICRLTDNASQYPYELSDRYGNVSLNCSKEKPIGYVGARDGGRPRQTRFLGY